MIFKIEFSNSPRASIDSHTCYLPPLMFPIVSLLNFSLLHFRISDINRYVQVYGYVNMIDVMYAGYDVSADDMTNPDANLDTTKRSGKSDGWVVGPGAVLLDCFGTANSV